MYVSKGGRGRVNVTLKKKHREQDYAISNQHWVCKFEEMGWDMFLRKKGNYCALSHKLMGGGCATLLKMGLRGILVCYFVKIEILAAEIVIIYLFIRIYFEKVHFCYNFQESFYRSCSVHVK